ncbi:dioxygenase family protein [Pseudovibrio sp. WM33]|uniref:dioxygenase family protein n=1 Tax=Pseudovibrio sp. WM33 TaxID=1735585 RepID=UPI0007AED615|nr:protocatechuate 3,4-dioxygenase [Pseudovibrio sp. WM33]KZL20008.1 Protocatechuate 3,4-dioxygenase beta chain [Pseudovibrio sp. WM33]
MTENKTSRRNLLGSITAFAFGVLFGSKGYAQVMTPHSTEGPYYPRPNMRMADVDRDLVRVIGQVRKAGGEVITLRGKVCDRNGSPRAGLRVEIWQCDLNGKYLHPGDRKNIEYDQGFQGFGYDITNEDGKFRFRTIKPVPYTGRTPHIHLKILDGNQELLTSQLYIARDPRNSRDSIYSRMSPEEAESVSMVITETKSGKETTVTLAV